MSRRQKSLIVTLIYCPWWVSVVLSAGVYIALAFVLPEFCADDTCGSVLRPLLSIFSNLAVYVAIILLIPAPFSVFRTWKQRRLLNRQRDIASIRKLNWKEFEELLGEYYRRKGFRVRENHSGGADGGVDLRLENKDGFHLVQCKQWRAQKVGVAIVRELYGVMAYEGATSGSVVTSGSFTQEAKRFAADISIELIDGERLEGMIAEVKTTGSHKTVTASLDTELCPRCGGTMVRRTARRGAQAGSEFFGCSSYPKCHYTRN